MFDFKNQTLKLLQISEDKSMERRFVVERFREATELHGNSLRRIMLSSFAGAAM